MSEVQGPIAISKDTNGAVLNHCTLPSSFLDQGPIQQETKTVLDLDSHERLLSCPLSFRGHVDTNSRTVISLFLLKETEVFVPRS